MSMARPRLSVRPLSDARFGSLKPLLGIDEEMQEVMVGKCRRHHQQTIQHVFSPSPCSQKK